MTDRYARQARFAAIGEGGQQRIRSSSALLVGVGALGTHLADTLVRAGIGKLWLVDRDVVEVSNLQRQVLFQESDLDTPKVDAAARALRAINPEVQIEPRAAEFDPELYESLDGTPDLLLDGTDNFPTRFLLNDLAARDQRPWIHGGVLGSRGTAMAILPGKTPCLRCLLPDGPAPNQETCETAGVLAPAVAAVTAFQATQALKILSGNADAVTRGILVLDVWNHEHIVRMENAGPAAHCATCRQESFPALDADWSKPAVLCGRDAVQVQPRTGKPLELTSLADRLHGVAQSVNHTGNLLRFEVDGCRFSVFPNGRALLFGTSDIDRARTLYDRYVGG